MNDTFGSVAQGVAQASGLTQPQGLHPIGDNGVRSRRSTPTAGEDAGPPIPGEAPFTATRRFACDWACIPATGAIAR